MKGSHLSSDQIYAQHKLYFIPVTYYILWIWYGASIKLIIGEELMEELVKVTERAKSFVGIQKLQGNGWKELNCESHGEIDLNFCAS